ncbi:hypothetical protein [Deinococcus sp. Leaf326]|uniref:hypothetical protein n=1 Tax=Deinococcus sp. Leaf326 TaxID=1736338 RepID=UPI0006F3FBB3|nr:hypothetical protein [Deinococcus sp. Leaf326]KQR15598.1 hypothetical protein ASF71_08140 [Deinococcus sp. Leaf326]
MTRAKWDRVRQLEERQGERPAVRVTITRRILGGEGEAVRIVRRTFELYPSGLPLSPRRAK